MKHLASKAPDVDIFGQGLVRRHEGCWQLTDKGRAFLQSIETATANEPAAARREAETCESAGQEPPRRNVIYLDDHRRQPSRDAGIERPFAKSGLDDISHFCPTGSDA
jgi:hypothetical protein